MRLHVPENNSVPVEKVIPENMEQLFLPLYLKHPAALKLRNAGIFMAGISEASSGFRLRRTPDFLFAVFTRSGTGEMAINGELYQLGPGSFFLAPAHCEQLYFQTGSDVWRFLWFHLKMETPLLQPVPSEPAAGRYAGTERLEMAMEGFASETVQAMQSLISPDDQPPWNFYCDSDSLPDSLRTFHFDADESNRNAEQLAGIYAELILGLLDRALHSLLERFDGDERSDRLDRLWNRISGDLAREWPLAEMASYVHMSIPTLIRQSRRRYDVTPVQMLYHLRLKRAAQLLLSSRMPVTAIARETGFAGGSTFASAFRKEYGMTPRLYRRTHQV